MDRLGRLILDHDVAQWMTSLETSVDLLEKAKTSDDKIKAAQSMVSVIRTIK